MESCLARAARSRTRIDWLLALTRHLSFGMGNPDHTLGCYTALNLLSGYSLFFPFSVSLLYFSPLFYFYDSGFEKILSTLWSQMDGGPCTTPSPSLSLWLSPVQPSAVGKHYPPKLLQKAWHPRLTWGTQGKVSLLLITCLSFGIWSLHENFFQSDLSDSILAFIYPFSPCQFSF